jgi:hypothetical protein
VLLEEVIEKYELPEDGLLLPGERGGMLFGLGVPPRLEDGSRGDAVRA